MPSFEEYFFTQGGTFKIKYLKKDRGILQPTEAH